MPMSRPPRGAVAGMIALLRDACSASRNCDSLRPANFAPSSIAAINGQRDRRTIRVTDRRHIH